MCAEAGDGSRVWGKANCSSRSMVKPALVMAAAVSRPVWQPPNRVGHTVASQHVLNAAHACGPGADVLEEAQLPARP